LTVTATGTAGFLGNGGEWEVSASVGYSMAKTLEETYG